MSTRALAIKMLIRFDRELKKLEAKGQLNGAEQRHVEQLKAIKKGLLKQ